MNSLTDEQRKRMEENRRKAMEKRAAAAANRPNASSAGAGPSVTPKFSAPVTQNRQNTYPSSSGNATNFQHKQNQSHKLSVEKSSNTGPMSSNYNNGHSKNSAPTSKPYQVASVKSSFGTQKMITGTCRIISNERFEVECGYHPQLIETMRTLPSSRYNAIKRTWSFLIAHHGDFVKAIESLRPDVCIGTIPPNILKVFRTSYPDPLDFDISCIDPALYSALMNFQKYGVQFGVSRNGRLMICDDMGLGKTIQALGIAHYYVKEWPLLIVCPSSVKYTWRESIWKWIPSVNPGSINILETTKDLDSGCRAKICITSFDLYLRNGDKLDYFDVIIIDESHNLKSMKAARTKAILPILQKAKRAILLSGTPALSRPMELYSQIICVNRNIFPSLTDFGIRYCDGKKNAWGWDFSGSSNLEELQLILERSIMIRRLKADVFHQMPSKRREMKVLDPSLVHSKSKSLLSKAANYNSKSKSMEKHGCLLEYYAETGRVKLDAVRVYIKELVEQKKKFICFAHHKEMLDGLSESLNVLKCTYIRIDGSTSSEERSRLCDYFQHTQDCYAAILSITAANAGISLTSSQLVVFAELFWNPGILTQAEDRVHRIGQADNVTIQYLVARGTSDDILWPMLQEKLDILNKAGLSKDDFRDADSSKQIVTASELQQATGNNGIEKYFTRCDNNSSSDNAKTKVTDLEENVIISDDDDDDIFAKAIELEASSSTANNIGDGMMEDDSFLQVLDDPEIEAAMMACSEDSKKVKLNF